MINTAGQLIGINTAKLSSTELEGTGYAIPISEVWDIFIELAQEETVSQHETEAVMEEWQSASNYNNYFQPFYNMPDMPEYRVYE